jgi:polyisoprenoid-binding protein YceI
MLALAAAAPVSAQQWKIDPHHSQLEFTIDHIAGKVKGFFNEFSFPDKKIESKVVFDPDKPEQASFDVVINTWSLDSGIQRRDKHLATSDFFDSRNFPVIRFTSEKVRKIAEDKYEAAGKLTIKDVSKTVTVPFSFIEPVKHPNPEMDTRVMALEARITISRLEYNVGDGKFFNMGLVGDTVCLVFHSELLEVQ